MKKPDQHHKIVVERIINASQEKVFNAFLDPSIAARWMFGPQTYVAQYCFEPKVGGQFSLLMKSDDQEWPHDGEVLVFDPLKRLTFTWLSPSTSGVVTQVDIQLFYDAAHTTQLVLTHSLLGENYRAFTTGWHELLDQLCATLVS